MNFHRVILKNNNLLLSCACLKIIKHIVALIKPFYYQRFLLKQERKIKTKNLRRKMFEMLNLSVSFIIILIDILITPL